MDSSTETLIAELKCLGADQKSHSGRSLLAHLIGVNNILVDWGNPEFVARAGLFHSIYGTEAYQTATVGLNARSRVRALIGADSERLAYLFCATDQRELIWRARRAETEIIMDRFRRTETPITYSTFCALAEIGAANLMEQIPYIGSQISADQFLRVARAWMTVETYVSGPARASLEGAERAFLDATNGR